MPAAFHRMLQTLLPGLVTPLMATPSDGNNADTRGSPGPHPRSRMQAAARAATSLYARPLHGAEAASLQCSAPTQI